MATSVAEEGLDIRQCNVVIRFDLAKTVLAYIQSRGRARKPGSDYILMVERYLFWSFPKYSIVQQNILVWLRECKALYFLLFNSIPPTACVGFGLMLVLFLIVMYLQSFNVCGFFRAQIFCLVTRGNLSHEAFLRNARNSEETLRKEAIERTDLSHLKDASRLISVDTSPGTVYQVESTGAVVSLNSAVGLIHFYCSQLPSDRYFFF